MKQTTGAAAAPIHRRKNLRTWLLSFLLVLTAGSTLTAQATVLPTISLSCTQPTTATTVCVGTGGYFANGWATPGNGYWQWTVNTTGFHDITFSTPTSRSSALGPTTGSVYYSVGGGPFILVTTFNVPTSCTVIGPISLPAACNNQTLVTVRAVMSGATANTATHRVASANVFTGLP